MRFWYAVSLIGFALPACVLPSVEVDENFSPGGSGGSAGRAQNGGAGGLAGRGGGAGNPGVAGSAGAVGDEREALCISYCDSYYQVCEDHQQNTYDDVTDCRRTCVLSDWPLGVDADEKNSVKCRVAHAELAITLGVTPHCFHSAEFPTMGACEP